MPTTLAATLLGDLGTLIAQCVFAFIMLLVAIWGQVSLGNRALKMGQDIAFGSFTVFVWFIGVSQLISGRAGGLVLVIVTLLMATALIDPVRRATWARVLPIGPDDRMHMLGLVSLLFAASVFFLTSASVAAPIGTPTDRVFTLGMGANAWTTGDGLPAPRAGLGLVAVGDTLYAVGGEDGAIPVGSVEAYTSGPGEGAGRWQERARLAAPRAHAAVAELGGKVYVIGGDRDGAATATVSVYDPAADAWTEAAPLPEPRTALAAGALNGRLYAVGGTAENPATGKARASGTVFAFDPGTNAWTAGPSLTTPRSDLAVTVADGRLYAIGGQDGGRVLARTEVSDGRAWMGVADLPEPRADLAATATGSRVFAVGGTGAAEATPTVQVYDFGTARWSAGPELLAGRTNLGLAAVGGRVYAVGGASDQLTQIVPTGGLLFAVGQAIIIGGLAVLLVGVGVRRVPRAKVARATPELAGAAGGRGDARRGVIASSLDEAGGKQVYGTRFRWRRTPAAVRDRLGLAAATPATLLVGVLTAVALVAMTFAGQWITAALAPDLAANVSRIAAQAQANIGGFAAAAVAAILVAVGEELLFRGAIQPRFGILLTALAFAALHTQYGFGVAPLTVLALGLALGLARRLANTTATLIAHVLYVVVMLALVAAGMYMG